MTRAPADFAIRSASSDTPPVPIRSTVWPRSSGRTPVISAFHAVTPAQGSVAASSKPSELASFTTPFSGSVT